MSAPCPACLNGCGGTRTDCPMRAGGPVQRPAIGRPVVHTPDVAEAFLERIAEGRSMRSICSDADMPSWSTIWRWLDGDEAFRTQYARAREAQAHAIAEQAVQEATAAADAQLGRLAYDARKWFAGKVAPKVYGDKQQIDVADTRPLANVPAEVLLAAVRKLSGEGG